MFLVRHVYLYNPPWSGPSEGSPQRISEKKHVLTYSFSVYFVTVSMDAALKTQQHDLHGRIRTFGNAKS